MDRGPGTGFDVEGGITLQVFPTWLDLRTKVNAYGFNSGEGVYGIKAGIDLSTRDGLFTLRLDHGVDRHLADYTTVGGFINVGLTLGNLLRGGSPFSLPDPIFASPRNIRNLLTRKVERNWHQSAASVVTRSDTAQSIASEQCLQLVATRTFTSTINWNGSSTAVIPFVEGALPASSIPANNVIQVTATAMVNDADQLLELGAASNTTPVRFTRPTTPYVPVPFGQFGAYSVDVIAPFGLTAAGVTSVTGTVSAGKKTQVVGTIQVFRRLCPVP